MQIIEDPFRFFSKRAGETRIGETLRWYTEGRFEDFLQNCSSEGCRVVIVGIPESIGPVANLGLGGSEHGWSAFLSAFAGVQDTPYLAGSKIAVAGTPLIQPLLDKFDQTETADLQEIRRIVNDLDDAVYEALLPVFRSGMLPIVIGGGHNNAYPLIKAASTCLGKPIQVINCDPHADFRSMEGRHSGNGFTYAMDAGYLERYQVTGLHQSYNSREMLARMDENPSVSYSFFDDEPDPVKGWQKHPGFLNSSTPTGIELDTDAIAGFPSSARTPVGISLQEAMAYLQYACQHTTPAYLHLPEAAPDPQGKDYRYFGKALAYLVISAIKELIRNKK